MSVLVYANNQVVTFIKWSLRISGRNFPSLRHVQQKDRPKKLPFIANFFFFFFAPFGKVRQNKKKMAILKRSDLQANIITLNYVFRREVYFH